jgi:hypothetical protein
VNALGLRVKSGFAMGILASGNARTRTIVPRRADEKLAARAAFRRLREH